jgi:hypothetical protein
MEREIETRRVAVPGSVPYRAGGVLAHLAGRLTGRTLVSIADLALLHLGVPAALSGCQYLIGRWWHPAHRNAHSPITSSPANAAPAMEVEALNPERR